MAAGDKAAARGVSILAATDFVNGLPLALDDMLDDLVQLPGKISKYFLNNAQALPAGFTKLTGWTAVGSVDIPGFNAATGTFTVPAGAGGTYRFSWSAAVATAAGMTRAASCLFVNGVQDITVQGDTPTAAAANGAGALSWPLVLAAAATVDLRIFLAGAASTAYITGNNTNVLTIERLG